MKLGNKFNKKILGTVTLTILSFSLTSATDYNHRTKHAHSIFDDVSNNHINDEYNPPADRRNLFSSIGDDYSPPEGSYRRHAASAHRQNHEKNADDSYFPKGHTANPEGFVLDENSKEMLEVRAPQLEPAVQMRNSVPQKIKFDKPIRKKYRYVLADHGKPATNDHDRPPVQFRSFIVETPKPHAFVAEGHGQGYSIHPVLKLVNEKTDIYGMKTTPWKQLGPNLEIAKSGDGTIIDSKSRLNELVKDRAKNTIRSQKPKRAKNSPKNLRSSYHMGEQHALYVANDLDQPVKTVVTKNTLPFDHTSMLKQSDRFEITDAMYAGEEADKDEAFQSAKGEKSGRAKQESPGGGQQLQYIEMPSHQQIPLQYQQFAALPVTGHAFEAAAIPPLAPKYVPPFNPYAASFPTMATLGKGFIRNIEIEMTSSGAKKTMPALIIPLSPDQLEGVGSYLNTIDSPTAPFYLNQPQVPTSKPKSTHPFPYNIETPARFPPQEILINNHAPNTQHAPPSPFETYPPQHLYPAYQYKPSSAAVQPSPQLPPTFQDEYGVFVNYQNEHVYSKLPYSHHNRATSLPASTSSPTGAPLRTAETGKPMPVAFSTQTLALGSAAAEDARPNRQSSPYSVTIPSKKPPTKQSHQSRDNRGERVQVEHRISDDEYEQRENSENDYSPSLAENSGHVKRNTDDDKPTSFENSTKLNRV